MGYPWIKVPDLLTFRGTKWGNCALFWPNENPADEYLNRSVIKSYPTRSGTLGTEALKSSDASAKFSDNQLVIYRLGISVRPVFNALMMSDVGQAFTATVNFAGLRHEKNCLSMRYGLT